MCVRKVFIKNFRNIDCEAIELSNSINLFYGHNAQGKTNFLEALYLCAIGRSMRTNIEQEMINFKQNEAKIELIFSDNESISVNLSLLQKKSIFVNGNQINKLGELFGRLPTIIFSPEDLQLIKSNPAMRRKFMDTEICQINKIYYYELKQYYRSLHQRNSFLKKFNDANKKFLDVWDKQLIEHGMKIIEERKKFVDKINSRAAEIYSHITNKNEKLNIIYKPNVMAQDFASKIIKHHDYDILIGSTSIGIHKDDLLFEINNKPVKIFASQGQQKTVAITLKLAEINLIYETTNKFPLLLLDDILSELDESRRYFLIDYIKNFQVLLTCSENQNLIRKDFPTAKFFHVRGGKFFNENGA